tara:strand:+ start:732 stop:1523 length:792 start_codon:yes stop_codon:yes gene_type:complete
MVKNTQDRLIARAENHYLYLSDIKDQLSPFKSNEDSIAMVRGLINNWARKKLIYEKSLINLPENKISKINSMVEDYKSNLYRNSYREFVLKSLMDTVLSKELISEFYESNKKNFKLKEPLYRIRLISFPLDNVDRKEIINRFRRFESNDIYYLDSLSFQFSNYFLADTIWLNKFDVFEKVSFLRNENVNYYLKKQNYFEVKDSLDLYLFQVIQRLGQDQIAPLPYIENTIKNIVFNKKKIDYMKEFDNDILEDATKTKKFETY